MRTAVNTFGVYAYRYNWITSVNTNVFLLSAAGPSSIDGQREMGFWRLIEGFRLNTPNCVLQFIFRKSRDDKLRREQLQVKYGVFISENTHIAQRRDFKKDNTFLYIYLIYIRF